MSYKTPEQIEFTDLAKQLKERFGFNQRKIASIAHVSESMVSQIVAGTRSPRGAALELLRREFDFLMKPAAESAVTPDELREVLIDLQTHAPEDYEVARVTIESLGKKINSARLRANATEKAQAVTLNLARKQKQNPENPGP